MTDTRTVDPNMDNLDDFNDLMLGRAKETEPEATEEVVEETEEDEADDSPEEVEALETDSDEETPKPEEKPKKNRFQDRIDELTRQRHEADREKAELRRQLDEALKQKTEDKPTKAAESPTPDDKNDDGSEKYPLGEFDPSYIRDLTRFTIGEEKKAFEADAKRQSEERIAQEAAQRQLEAWKGKLDDAVENKYPDFLEKNAGLEETFRDMDEGYSSYLASTIMEMDHGVDVLYYLASNPSEAKRIAGLGATKATIALGRIEASFDAAETAKKQPKVSRAAPPPETNRGTSVATTVKPDTDDLDAFEKEFFKRKR